MNDPRGHSAKGNEPVTERSILHDPNHMMLVKWSSSETRISNSGGQRLWGGRKWEWFKDYRVSILSEKKNKIGTHALKSAIISSLPVGISRAPSPEPCSRVLSEHLWS